MLLRLWTSNTWASLWENLELEVESFDRLGIPLMGVLYAALVLQPNIHAVKAQMASFERLAPTDPLRLAYARLHGCSFAVKAAVLLLGLVVVCLTAFTMKI